MPYTLGVGVALAVFLFARLTGVDCDRSFFPLILVVVASYCDVLAILTGSGEILTDKSLAVAAFILSAAVGFKKNLWIVVAALVGHGALDLFHADLVVNAGAPDWWPMFCLSFDVVAGGYLAHLLLHSSGVDRSAVVSLFPKRAKFFEKVTAGLNQARDDVSNEF